MSDYIDWWPRHSSHIEENSPLDLGGGPHVLHKGTGVLILIDQYHSWDKGRSSIFLQLVCKYTWFPWQTNITFQLSQMRASGQVLLFIIIVDAFL